MKKIYSTDGVIIGSVPDNWSVNKTLRCLEIPITDGPHETPVAVDEENGIPFVSAEAVSCGNGNIDFDHIWGYISPEYYRECCKKYTPQINDIYMIKSGATTGKVAIVNTDRIFTIWSPLAVFRANQKVVTPRYLYYFLQSPVYLSQVELGWNYGTQQNIGMRVLEKLYVCYPSLPEQQAIVRYLDQKCAAIDEAIDRHKKIIEKLEEYRSASISVATTHGINKNIPLKESGVDWCPRVPITWTPINPKALFSQRKDRAYEGDKQLTSSQKSGIIFQEEFERMEGRRVVEVIKDFSILKHVEPGDFVISMRSFEGGLEYSYNRGCISSAYVMLVPNHKRICSEFYKWFFKSSKYINAIQATTNLIRDGQAMRYANFISVPLFDIPIDEQEEIASYLNNLCTHIDASIQKHNSIIEKLMDYRKSIIYQAVTGKIDCRKEAV